MSSIKMIHAYWRERYPVSIFVPFASLIAAVGFAAGGSLPTVRDALMGCVVAYTLVFVFRVADDLADLASDRLRHPGRVLVQASSVTPIVMLAFVLAAGDVMIILWQPRPAERLTVLAAMSLFLLLWYVVRARLRSAPLASAHVILVKYPVVSLLTCANWDYLRLPTALPFFAALYLGMCIYEQLHDRAVRDSRGGTWIFAAEVGLLVCIPLLLFSTGGFLR